MGSGFLRNNPLSSFEEMMERMKSVRESQSEDALVDTEKSGNSMFTVTPGSDNRIVTLMI